MSKSAFLKFQKGEPLTRKQAMSAQCYECNGYSVERAHDCLGTSCPLYQWSPWAASHGLRAVKRSNSNLKKKSEVI
jgi:hypothetical protein